MRPLLIGLPVNKQMRGMAVLIVLAAALPGMAKVKLAGVFGDHMVLQQQTPVAVWGGADAGEKVVVTIAGQTHPTLADDAGRWKVTLDPMRAADHPGPVVMRINDVTVSDILIGEVWLCSGQSNMEMTVSRAKDAATEIAAADFPAIRLMGVKRWGSAQPVDSLEFACQWSPCTPKTIVGFSATGYYFGRDLHQALKVPIGLINSSLGGATVESWTSRPALDATPEAAVSIAYVQDEVDRREELLAKYERDKLAYDAEVERAKAAGEKPKLKRPRPPHDWTGTKSPAAMFNAMLHPLIPFTMRGAIWYQGEANYGRSYAYRALLPALIADWRTRWGQPAMPFGVVQLANYHPVKPNPAEYGWCELREAQFLTAQNDPHVGIINTIDIGEVGVHPVNKQDVGKRLALWALAKVYGRSEVVFSGPRYRDAQFKDGKVYVHFDHAHGGLIVKGDELKGFALAGDDKKFAWAQAKVVDNTTVVVWSEQVPKPASVRYAWAENPVCNLYNTAGLPAFQFRTDQWPGVTAKR
jgi:sialate O-acetylesterase